MPALLQAPLCWVTGNQLLSAADCCCNADCNADCCCMAIQYDTCKACIACGGTMLHSLQTQIHASTRPGAVLLTPCLTTSCESLEVTVCCQATSGYIVCYKKASQQASMMAVKLGALMLQVHSGCVSECHRRCPLRCAACQHQLANSCGQRDADYRGSCDSFLWLQCVSQR